MPKAILGPVLSDILALSHGRHFVLASAFYSEARLDATTITARSSDVLVRLDLKSIKAWVDRAIAPDALLRFWTRHQGNNVSVYYGPRAHVKVYAGDHAFLVGSANFTVRGLGGFNDEILWRESAFPARSLMMRALRQYRASLKRLDLGELEEYVGNNIERVKELQKRVPASDENVLPSVLERPRRVGTYETFLRWLDSQNSSAAREILDRAHGKGQLSGHIRMNFFGIRQFLLAHPNQASQLRLADPGSYKLCNDPAMEQAIARFVKEEAADEGGLEVSIWTTYLPMRSGGAPKSGGGTSGNLNRMLPLLSRFYAGV